MDRCYICDAFIPEGVVDIICDDCAGIIAICVAIETDRELGYAGLN